MAEVGSIHLWPVSTIPSGYLPCDGSPISRTTYATLFSVIGVMYGSGDGSMTFNLPDFRGHFPRVKDAGAGIDPDTGSRTPRPDGSPTDSVGTKQSSAFGSHRHYVDTASTFTNGTTGAVWCTNSGTPIGRNTTNYVGSETRPININIIPIIKY